MLTILAMLAVFAIFLNLPWQYVELHSSGRAVSSIVDFPEAKSDLPVMAGIPFRFWISYPANESLPGRSVFSFIALLLNLLIVAVVLGLFGFYLHRRGKHHLGKRRTNLTIADMLLLTFVLAACFGGWQYQQSRAEKVRSYAKKLTGRGDSARLTSWVPSIFKPLLPEPLARMMVAVRAVRLENPSDEQVREAVSIKTLTGFRIGGDAYNLRTLDDLGRHIHLIDLRLAGRTLDEQAVRMIASQPRLVTLNLMRTNIDANALQSMDRLANLRHVNLMHTDVRLSDLGRPPWADSVETLVLPHPESGEDKLVIDGWRSLEELKVNELDTRANSTPLRITLTDLPALKAVHVDRFQAVDLTLTRLPALQTLEPMGDNWQSRIARGGSVPGQLWLTGLVAEGVPKLESVKFYTPDLQRLQITDAPRFDELLIGTYRIQGTGQPNYEKLSPKVAQALVDGLGAGDGPELIDLDAVSLGEEVDLSPLSANTGIRTLFLGATGTGMRQWKQLASMKQLRQLRLDGNPTTREDIHQLLELFPRLEVLECRQTIDPRQNQFMATRFSQGGQILELRDHANLQTIECDYDQDPFYESVHVVNMPQLKTNLDLGWVRNELEIRNAGGLRGLSISSELPTKVLLEGLSGLDYFAAGGSRVDDGVVASLAACKQLSKLTLAYASASEQSLRDLPLGSVRGLHLPGCNVTDEVVEAWPELDQLETLDLSHTQITAKSLAKLLKSSYLMTVRLDGCQIAPTDLKALAEKDLLRKLSLSGVGIDAKTLASLAGFGTLQELDLSGGTIDDGVLDAAASASGLQLLILHDCQLSSKKLFELSRVLGGLQIDPTGTDLETNAYTRMLSLGKIVDLAEYRQRQAFEAAMSSGQTSVIMMSNDRDEDAIINPANFAPAAADELEFSGQPPPAAAPSTVGQLLQGLFQSGTPAGATSETDAEVIDRNGEREE